MKMTADRIKALREARGWTQAELARRLNITRNGVNSWEQGLSMPSPACLVDLAKLFSVSTDYLLGVERLETVNVTGLDEKDVAMLAQLAERLRETR
jgi:transcriptional regulator with XRE-family HTH domain